MDTTTRFAVAVTDSTGQHGPWSDQLTVTYDGINHEIHYNTHDVVCHSSS